MFERKKVGLALGSGGARGLAHIGVLKVLEEYKIPIDFIAGSSMGAIIGALYSSEPNSKKLEKESLDLKWGDLFDYTIPKRGLIKGDKIEAFLREKLDKLDFKDMKIPLFVTAYDVENDREIVFHKGDVVKAVRASMSIPGIFVPVENNKRILVDGGVIDPVPVKILKDLGAEVIIAVNVDYVKEKKTISSEKAVNKKTDKKIPNVIHTISKSLQVMSSEACRTELKDGQEDLIITPKLEKFGTFDFGKAKKIIALGEKEARKSLEEIKNLTEPHPFKQFLESLIIPPEVNKLIEEVKKQ